MTVRAALIGSRPVKPFSEAAFSEKLVFALAELLVER
jgi:hypothetical protein